jgi:hypothetical protein
MALINGNMDENYFRSIVKNISYIYDDLFTPEDIALIEKNTFFDNDEDDMPEELTSQGLKQNDARNLTTTMWQTWNDEVSHSFENIYAKLICCLGDQSGTKKALALSIPIYKDGEIKMDKRTYSIGDAQQKCLYKGLNFYDDNKSTEGYNTNCEALMNKYCLFLQKYDPENPLIDDLCGCILGKKYITQEMPAMLEPQNAAALANVLGQRNCGISKCIKQNAYRRQTDREQCVSEINICSNTIAVTDVEAGSAEFKNINLSNDCGGNKVSNPTNTTDLPEEVTDAVTTDDGDYEASTDTTDTADTADTADTTTADTTAADTTAADTTAADTTAADTTAADTTAADTEEELGFFAKIMAWFSSLFGGSSEEGFSPKNNKFDQMYSVFSIIVVYMLIFKDPLKIQKKIQKMF